MVLKAFDTSKSTARPYPFLSSTFFDVSIQENKTCCVLKPFLYQHI